jgi:hypothetical protein
MSLVLKYCSSRIRTKFKYTSNTSKFKLSVLSIAQNSLNSTWNPGSWLNPSRRLNPSAESFTDQQVAPVSGKFLGN